MPNIRGHSFLIGADPEVFIESTSRKNEFLSAFGVCPGTKKNPYRVNRGFIQVDGMAMEYNIEPAATQTAFITNITSVQKDLKAYLPPGYRFSKSSIARWPKAYMTLQPSEATELGCDPDFSAYTGKFNPTPNAKVEYRTASGHIHIGWTKDMDPMDPGHFAACRELTIALDFYLGQWEFMWDLGDERKTLYGQPGAFRPKSYGMEYRVLSNAWTFNKNLMKMVYDQTIYAIMSSFESDYSLEYCERYRTYELVACKHRIKRKTYRDRHGTHYHRTLGMPNLYLIGSNRVRSASCFTP